MSKFIGLVSAYAYAKSKGYTGTEEEFAILMAEYASVTETAVEAVRIATESARSAAAASSDVNRAAATVTQQAAQVHDDAETSSESAATASEAKETAVDKALDSEAYALGTRDGEDVGSSDPAYHNNAKYYAEQGGASAQTATEAAQTATQKASDAQASASAAAESARTLTIDTTLTQSGQAADSKVVGDEIAGLKEDLDVVNDAVGLITGSKAITFTKGGRINTSGNLGTIIDLTPISSDSYSYAIVDCSESDEFILNCEGAGTARPWVFINSSNALIKYSPGYTSGANAYVVAPSGASKLVVNSKNTALGNCINGINLKDSVDNLWSKVETEHTISTADLIQQNANFIIQNGNISVVSNVRPFNSLLIKSSKIEFDFARVNTSIPLYIGVAIGGHFVGNQTRTVVADIREIYDEANNEFTGATLNISTGDENYSNTPAHFTAEINGNVFTLKKGDTIIFRFTISPLYAVDGIAILNYNFTTIQNCFVVNNLAQDGINDVYKIANRADIIGLQSNHRMIAGVIRNSGSGWEFIINDRHQGDMNCVSVGISVDGRIYVDYSGINAKKVISAIFAPDEDFASRGFFIGASVGLDKAYPEIYQNTLNAVYGIIEYNASTEVFDVSNSEGITSAVWGSDNMLTITHNQIVSGVMIPCVAIYGYGRYIPCIYSFGDTTTKIRFFNANANTGVTTPDGYMRIVFGRFDPVLRRTKIDPATLVSGSGNIWFTGIFEV